MNPCCPTRQNWCTAEPALMFAYDSTATCPPSVACGPKIVLSPTRQSCATCTYAMNTLRSPIAVTPPPPRVPRLMVTNSRKMLRRPIVSRVGSP